MLTDIDKKCIIALYELFKAVDENQSQSDVVTYIKVLVELIKDANKVHATLLHLLPEIITDTEFVKLSKELAITMRNLKG